MQLPAASAQILIPAARKTYSVSAVVTAADRKLKEACGSLWVRGEVSGWKRWRTGQCYFTLKDAQAELSCIMWAGAAAALPTDPGNGDEIMVFGQLGIYKSRGQFQLNVAQLEGTGFGGLWAKARDELMVVLRREGLLDEARKRPLPYLPERVGVVTSPQGAALQDMHRALRRRAWWVTMAVSPCVVEGVGAAPDIARAIGRFGPGRCEVDVVLVARGGGSPESLWAFNTEEVARAIAACPYPVVSAVGHETDFTVADSVADRRAATPTAGAEIVVPEGAVILEMVRAYPAEIRNPVRRSLMRNQALLDGSRGEVRRAVRARVRLLRERTTAASVALEGRSPRRRLAAMGEELLRLRRGMSDAVARRTDLTARALASAAGALEARSPLHVLSRGYALLTDSETGRAVRSPGETRPGQRLIARVAEGEIPLIVEEGS